MALCVVCPSYNNFCISISFIVFPLFYFHWFGEYSDGRHHGHTAFHRKAFWKKTWAPTAAGTEGMVGRKGVSGS